MSQLFLVTLALMADPSREQLDFLKTFRSEFVDITPGADAFPKSFVMGHDGGNKFEQPAHRVSFNYSFSVAKYEVPQNLWEAVMGSNPSRWKGPRNSVEWLSFDEAVEFCKQATELMRAAKLIKPNEVIRLPSEAEWEYFARAGTTTAYSFGDDLKDLDEHAWHTGNAAGNDPPVGAKNPNPWGLYDIHGYLWEWCADAAHDNYESAPSDGSPWIKGGDGSRRVIRGGSWKDPAESLTSSCRHGQFRHIKARGAKPEMIVVEGGVDRKLRDDAVGLRCILATQSQ
jgi:formylglycine-generating enzyme required for sulfatase activity